MSEVRNADIFVTLPLGDRFAANSILCVFSTNVFFLSSLFNLKTKHSVLKEVVHLKKKKTFADNLLTPMS